jgi:hypothetical protein
MFAATDTAWAPWYVAGTDDKQRGRLNLISHLLSQVPYKLRLDALLHSQASSSQPETRRPICQILVRKLISIGRQPMLPRRNLDSGLAGGCLSRSGAVRISSYFRSL